PRCFSDYPSAEPLHHLRGLAHVDLGIGLSDGRRAVPQNRAGCIEARLPPYLRRLRVAQLVRRPVRHAGPLARLGDGPDIRADGVAGARLRSKNGFSTSWACGPMMTTRVMPWCSVL